MLESLETTFEIIERDEITTISPFWISDKTINNCNLCQTVFSMFNRRHHCRICGRIYCYFCCTSTTDFQKDFQVKSIGKSIIETNKVCKTCNDETIKIKENKLILNIFSY